MKKSKFFITKAKIKKYLNEYSRLNKMIRQAEMRHIKYAPNFSEYLQNINTIEQQVIAMANDYKLQEMRFYKQNIDKYFYRLLRNSNVKIHNYSEVVEYLYQKMKKEV